MTKTKIENVDRVWNIAPGCQKITPECENCWAVGMAHRLNLMGQNNYLDLVTPDGKNWTGRVKNIFEKINQPYSWKKPCSVFVNSMGDLFYDRISVILRSLAFEVMCDNPQHKFFIYTKRVMAAEYYLMMNEKPSENIYIMLSLGTQRTADAALEAATLINSYGWNVCVNSEPRLEAIAWQGWEFIKQLIIGAESGKDRRQFDYAWAWDDLDFCLENNIRFFVKQGSHVRSGKQGDIPDDLWVIKERL